MADPKLYLSRDDYRQRLSKTRDETAKRNLDLLIVTDPSNMNWLTVIQSGDCAAVVIEDAS